ncbi:MAG: hypothetical protein ACRC2V_07495 [Xenococcaceae cyanobacterium]
MVWTTVRSPTYKSTVKGFNIMVYQELKRSQVGRSQVATKEYVVVLLTTEADEYNAPTERTVNVVWDAGIIPDWVDWLKLYVQDEQEEYQIDEIIEVGQREYEI